jgi:hypothetical protein
VSRGDTHEVFGERLTIKEMAFVAGTPLRTMCARVRMMPPERAVSQALKSPPESIVGKTYGQMRVLAEVGLSAHHKKQVICQCSCGSAPKGVVAGDLKSGRIVSCGCVFRAKASQRALARAEDMTGQTFSDGAVTVLGPVGLAETKAAGQRVRRWVCMCRRCGTTFRALANNLKSGFVTSCGCRKRELHRTRLLESTPRYDFFGASLTMAEISDVAGVKEPTILSRMREFGMSPEMAAFTTKLRTRPSVRRTPYFEDGWSY